jgi:hypothetical protein
MAQRIDMDSGTILGWLTAAVAGVAAVVTASVRGEKLRNRVEVLDATSVRHAASLARHDELIGFIKSDLHGIRGDLQAMRALSERDNE